ncbi:squalene/phytoene synthase family protein [Gluconacetobacter entanii]|uniref:phytoene/squalene synthase family protein n=1 Tax=Gluconacetobacter entanii TaxID=108528 RepID=UPI001C932120|nr:squalene/phytoene synthase family protein [Gluconacetobacter entanii]MBY4640361.1 squalene/phytoene synthase family protein [Gluconacetobacter entanii]MCW4582054.1 squalene/phytoene synthase family protein [Gluconacetobacter entanii]MCW4585586.1 squalene/phytoene synthase family protein [Gluconacetobacter entanii]MCW4586089.1 squalene/phytoene synthase family protein [Gluconacetobacter entanii]
MTPVRDAEHSIDGLSECGAVARRFDPDRFLCALFMPAPVREAAMTLIAFNHECVRALSTPASWSVAGPIAGMIRLQWWRDVIDGGDPQRHPVAIALVDLLARGAVRADTVRGIVDARECELDGLPDWPAWRENMCAGAGGVQRAMAQAMGCHDDAVCDAVAGLGAVYGAGALARHLGAVLRSGRCPLPDEALETVGLSRDGMRDGHAATSGQVAALHGMLRTEGEAFHARAMALALRLPRAILPAALPAVLGRRDLKAGGGQDGAARGVGDRLAVMAAMARGRV